MENPAHVYTTGIPMSAKGNDVQTKYGSDKGKSPGTVCALKDVDCSSKNNSSIVLSDITCENTSCISNSIQDGDQSQILYGIVCDTNLPVGETVPLSFTPLPEVTSSQQSDSNIRFVDSNVSCSRVGSLSPVEGVDEDMDGPLDTLALSVPDISKIVNKLCDSDAQSDIVTLTIEEQQKKLNESISAIAKSLGLEDLLPESFQVEGSKDALSITVETDGTCETVNDTVTSSVSTDLVKCPVQLNAPNSPLDLSVDTDNIGLTGFGLVYPTRIKTQQDIDVGSLFTRVPVIMKDGSTKYLDASKEEQDLANASLIPSATDKSFQDETVFAEGISNVDNCKSETSISDSFSILVKNEEACKLIGNVEHENLLINDPNFEVLKEHNSNKLDSDQVNNTIHLINSENVNVNINSETLTVNVPSLTVENNALLGGNGTATVSFTTDKVSKKMHILVTTSQGQQVFEINTDSLGTLPVTTNILPATSDFQTFDPSDLQTSLQCSSLVNDANQETVPEQEGVEVESEDSNNDVGDDDDDDMQCDEETQHLLQFVKKLSSGRGRKKSWTCPIEGCGQILNRECKLRVHMINHKGARPFKCTVEGCDWAFTTPYRLRRHLETHIGKKDYICDFEGCNRRFTTVYNLNTHKKRHKWPNALTCPAEGCGMSFANRRKMELHLRVHTDIEAPYKCSVCGKKYYSANCIASHYRTHQYNEDDFKCPFQGCGKKYDKICRLKQHIRHHTGDRPYVCEVDGCGWSFMSASKLTRHMRKHTGERKFVCPEAGCGKSFMRPEHLKGHIVIHSGDKPFQCPHENCNARFTAKSSLYVHMKKHCASGIKIAYSCPVPSCVKKYNNKATLKQHLQKIHPTFLEGKKQLDIPKVELTMPFSISVNTANSENPSGISDSEQNGIEASEAVLSELKAKNILAKQLMSNNISHLVNANQSLESIEIPPIAQTIGSSLKPEGDDHGTLKLTIPTILDEPGSPKLPCTPTEMELMPTRLLQENNSGSARTDYCCNHILSMRAKKWWLLQNRIRLGLINQTNEDSRQQESGGSFTTETGQSNIDIRSPDVMLASSSIAFQDQQAEQLVQAHFLPDEPSTTSSIYQEDSMLVNNSSFATELPLPAVALLSDHTDSNGSAMDPDASTDFSTSNPVDEFTESGINLQGLD